MRYRRLGNTGIRVSEISLGSWAMGGSTRIADREIGWGTANDEDTVAALRRAFDLGTNFVDTADVYGHGHSEEMIGKTLPDAGRDVYIATKAGYLPEPRGDRFQDFSPTYLKAACERSLKRLGREAIDLFQLHDVPIGEIGKGEAFEVLETLKREGKILHYGVTVRKDIEALAFLRVPGVETIQIVFNMLRQKPARNVFPAARTRGVGILARVPLASGLLADKWNPDTRFAEDDHRSVGIPGETFSGVPFNKGLEVVSQLRFLVSARRTMAQAALAWILAFDSVSSVIAGARTRSQVEENAAASKMNLSDQEMDLIHNVYRRELADQIEKDW